MKRRNGLTLIEVVVSIALMGMVVLVFLTIFNTSNRNITKAGDRTDDTFEIQEEIDDVIKDSGKYDSEKIEIKDDVDVKIDGLTDESILIKGKMLTGKKDKNGVKITTFVPIEEEDQNEE